MEVDYIIVGLGLAGLSFSAVLEQQNKTFVVFEDQSQQASKVASGVYNPIVLKRFTSVWNGHQQIERAIPFYESLENKLQNKYHHKFSIKRIFNSIEEQNDWFVAADKPLNSFYMISEICKTQYHGVKAPYGFGKLQHTGKIKTKLLIDDYHNYLNEHNVILSETFDYKKIEFQETKITYNGIKAKYIVFCEGYGIHKNPFFKNLPLQESKGEVLTIHAPELDINFMLKSAVFVLPLGNHFYKVGATFNWVDKTSNPSLEAKDELLNKLNTFIKVDYKVVSQTAGIRPTVKDRRPLVGIHKDYKKIAVLNGLGTRGVMLAPTLANALYQYLENGINLSKEFNISRFEN